MQTQLHRTINKVFGYVVQWTPSTGGPMQEAQVLFNDPTKTYKLGDADYSPNLYSIDWIKGDLEGLFQAVRGNKLEIVFLREIGSDISTAVAYNCMKAGAQWDGKTYHLVIEPS